VGLRHAGGDTLLYSRLCERFASRYDRFEETFRKALTAADTGQMVGLAHTLKGLAATLGADRLSLAAADLENASREPAPPDQIELWLAQVQVELAAVLPELGQLQPSVAKAAGTTAADAIAPVEELVGLAKMLSAGDVDSVDRLADLLDRYPGMVDSLQAVRRLAADYRFDEAAAALELVTAET
jgi:HPt (histidine-containing phosphotransfer) domain-containing protein